ncbi:protein FRIGIDA-ESSENTIAL 1-like isoform X2 [Rutidosis leptorrhynchoides]|uniref:protein FRIGIDA-ESSENTIAL 1-like isoform X2 n=1 Tax=Rutidosis leptorrhynchoides TaxID=125765 RepID=UPI003A9A018E
MPTTTAAAAAVPPTTAVTESQSPTASDSDEYEYEEIEIEEEIEVEEEVSDDEDEEFEEEEEDEDNAPPSIENLDDHKGKETIITVEEAAPQCDDELTRADPPNPFVNDTPVEEAATQCDGEVMKLMSADPVNSFTEASKELTVVEEASQCNGEFTSADLYNPFDVASKEVGPTEIPPVLEQTTTQMSNDGQQKEPEPEPRFSRLDVSGIIRRRSSSPVSETNDRNKRAALVCDFFAKGWCIKGNSCRFRHIEDQLNVVCDKQNDSSVAAIEPHDSKGLATTSAPAPTITCTSEMTDLPNKSNESPTTILNTKPQTENSVTVSPFNHPETNGMQENENLDNETKMNPFSSSIREHSGRGLHNHKFPTSNFPLNYNHSSNVWRNPSTYLSSPFSGSESERLHRSKDIPSHSSLFSEFSAYKWEPSRPFRSAFLISQGIPPPEIQYDPIRDSIEPPKIVDKAVEFLTSNKAAASISSKHSGQNVNPPLNETCDSNECELFTAKKAVNTNGEGNEKIPATITTPPAPATVMDNIVQENREHVSHYSLGQNDGPSREAKVGDEGSQHHHHHHKQTFDHEGDMNRESKAVRHFRAALIEFVKELVKPTWRDGKLSKDAHKMVVKKAVDKVLSTLPPEHVPTVQESVDTYLSSSKSKLAKLVEAYIEKYGKL